MIVNLQPHVQIVLAYIGAVSLLLAFAWLVVKVCKAIFKEACGDKESLPGLTEQGEMPGRNGDDEELVVVLAAAAYIARLRWQCPVVVRAVIPLTGRATEPAPAWAMAGRLEMTNPRLRR